MWPFFYGDSMNLISGQIKNYDWGTTDFLPELLNIKKTGEPFAEYWMGEDGNGNRTRFLFKVLSIAKPLSIQCHPTDEQAKEGFESHNPNYSSPYGKPEVICALTPLTARCGIKAGVSKEQVLDILENHQADLDQYLDKIMNKVTLQPGQCIYIKPGTLHQYVSGNGVELMNWSDNVIRGGMTSKHVDIEELKKIGSLEDSMPCFVNPVVQDDGRVLYDAPCDKFELRNVRGGFFCSTEKKDTIAIVLDGEITINDSLKFTKGQSIFIPAKTSYSLKSNGSVFFAC